MEQTAKEKAVEKLYGLSQSGYMADHAELVDLIIEAVRDELYMVLYKDNTKDYHA
jgi:hypothetical protein